MRGSLQTPLGMSTSPSRPSLCQPPSLGSTVPKDDNRLTIATHFTPLAPIMSAEERRAARKPIPQPVPAYLPTSDSSPLVVDRQAYSAIQQADRTLIEEFTLPIRSGRAWTAPAGSIVRISTPNGPQVGDLNIWNLHNPRERFWASRTRQLHASHVSTHDRLWSCLPYMRPLVTIVARLARLVRRGRARRARARPAGHEVRSIYPVGAVRGRPV